MMTFAVGENEKMYEEYRIGEITMSDRTEYISRQAAIDALDVLCGEHRYKIPGKRETYSQYNEAWQDALDRAEGAIDNLPSVDIDLSGFSDKLWAAAYERGKAEAVRHGKWIHDGYDFPHGVDWMHCSECGKLDVYCPAARTNFCPNCGARMDGKQDG